MSTVVTIGVFDSVHRGHQALLAAARTAAAARGAAVVALALDPHPNSVLLPDAIPPRVVGPDDKMNLLRQHGADRVERLSPTRHWLAQPADVFIEQMVRQYQPIAWVEGTDFRFGHQRGGDLAMLRQRGLAHGFGVIEVGKVEVVLEDLVVATVSSTLVRQLVAQGRMSDAAGCLGRPFSLTAAVVRGEQRGRRLGFATINLDLASLASFIRPACGVYAGSAQLPDGSTHLAAISVGDKPTFGGGATAIEAHLLDFAGDLYDQTVTLHFARWLRDQLSFPSPHALIAQLRRDAALTRELVSLD